MAKRQVGNFPQAFSHVSLVNSACNLRGHSQWTAMPTASEPFRAAAPVGRAGGRMPDLPRPRRTSEHAAAPRRTAPARRSTAADKQPTGLPREQEGGRTMKALTVSR